MEHKNLATRGWYYHRTNSPNGSLVRRLHGASGRVLARGGSRVARMRAATALARAQEVLGDTRILTLGIEAAGDVAITSEQLRLGPEKLQQYFEELLPTIPEHSEWTGQSPPAQPCRRVLFFESLMNTDMPHNDGELSQGVLHLASSLDGAGVDVVFANVKMHINGEERPVQGLQRLEDVVREPIDIVCITLLEGYFEGVISLIHVLRELGCEARIIVGGVMPSLAPEHVAVHLPDVQFVCRGAGEVILPSLVRILGRADVPLSGAQHHALLQLNGLIGLDQEVLISANTAAVPRVEDMDRLPLNLSYLLPRHIEGGIELSTSRGCIHRCTFCSILGRESYQAHSAGGVFELLKAYERHFEDLFGANIPSNAYRVHICDDDFACDKARAIEFFQALPSTRFRLSSVQVSVVDLCKMENGVLLPEVDSTLLDAIAPECFADSSRPIPTSDFFQDHRTRNWSAYLQLGVESYCNAELIRLGKGYRVKHVRAVVAEMASRELHMDGYFILSNHQTTAGDLLESLDELCRLKLRYPKWFHLRFPIVPHLVSYFTAASHRRLVRRGKSAAMALRRSASIEGYSEFDYPFVSHDIPSDPWVALAAEHPEFLTDKGRYTGSFHRLAEVWERAEVTGEAVLDQEFYLRCLDDRPRRLVFEFLEQVRSKEEVDPAWPGQQITEAEALTTARALLGPVESWLPALKQWRGQTERRLVVIPTWQCELRCAYCYIPKQAGRVMSAHTMRRSVDFLLSSDHPQVLLQFFGGEALLEWELVQLGIERGLRRAKELKKSIRFLLSSNGFSLTEEKLAWLSGKPVHFELSLDGDPATQNKFRRAADPAEDSYARGIADKARLFDSYGLTNEVIMVVPPGGVGQLAKNFFHIVDLGYPDVQINVGLGMIWKRTHQRTLADQLMEVSRELQRRWALGHRVMLTNLRAQNPMAIRLNGEVTVDFDGTIFGGNSFLHETRHKQRFVAGHLDEHTSFDRHWLSPPSNDFLLEYSYEPEFTKNNLATAKIFASFIQWMQQKIAIPLDR